MKSFKPLLPVFAVTLLFCHAVQAQPIKKDLVDLYDDYLQAGSSSLQMPEHKQEVTFAAAKISASKSFNGGDIIKVTGVQDGDEMARLTPADAVQAEAFSKIAEGEVFEATCVLGTTMGSSWIALQSCKIEQ